MLLTRKLQKSVSLGSSTSSSESPIVEDRRDAFNASRHKLTRHAGKKARKKMMENPYTCTQELDELSAEDSIIDYSVFSDENFVLIILLTSKGEAQAYLETGRDSKPRKNVTNVKELNGISANPVTICIGSQAAFVLFGLSDGNLLVTPIKTLIDVTWGGSSWTSSSVIDLSLPTIDPCLALLTCTRFFVSNFPPRNMAVVSNRAGNILLIDLQLRKCVSELKAPQSIHNMEVLLDENSIELLITGFTGAQWIVPIERNGKGFREVLTACIPADLKALEPPNMQFFASESCGIVALETVEAYVEIYSTIHSISHISKQTYWVPPETWLVHAADNAIFTVSNGNELRSALHFGLSAVRLEYSLVKMSTEWRPLGFAAMPTRPNRLCGVFVINERGLVRVEQSSHLTLANIAAEFIFRLPSLSLNPTSIGQIANAIRIDRAELQNSIIPGILSKRKHRTLSHKEISQILQVAKIINLSMVDLLKAFEKESMSEQLLSEVMNVIQSNPSKNANLMQKVVEMFVKRAAASECDGEKVRELDAELSSFLARHENLSSGSMDCARVGMWKCAQILANRQIHNTGSNAICVELLTHITKNGQQIWRNSSSTDRLQIMSLVCHLDWSKLAESDGAKICALLSGWQRDVTLPSYHEMCLRCANFYADKFPRPCQILALVSSIYIVTEKRTCLNSSTPEWRPIAGGNNCAAVIAEDDRILIFGNFTNQQQRSLDVTQTKKKATESSATSSTSNVSVAVKPEQYLAKVLEYAGGRPRAIACGAEHILVLSSAGQLAAWGGNRYGQCGVGHTFRLANLQQIEGDWPPITKISCGHFHSAFVCEDGSLWVFGWGVWGQLGLGGRRNSNVTTPTRVNGLIGRVEQVACGRAHTVVLTDNGRVLVAGSGSYGQMGTDKDIKKTFAFTPIQIDGSPRVTMIATSSFRSICVTDDERIFEWGRTPQEIKMKMFVMKKLRSAQLKCDEAFEETPPPSLPTAATGGPQPRQNLNLPAKIPRDGLGLREVKHFLNGKIAAISCGLSHCALITDVGSIYTWGKSIDYQLGNGNKAERSEPHQVFEPADAYWTMVSCGNNHTLASTRDGSVYGWGRNDFAQCGSLTKKATNETAKKVFFQAKDGRRFFPNLDDSLFVQLPTPIANTRVRSESSTTPESDVQVDETTMIEKLRNLDVSVAQAVSKHLCSSLKELDDVDEMEVSAEKYDGDSGPICTSTALVHLISGDVKRAIRMIELLKSDRYTPPEALEALSSLVWEVMANHEDVQSRNALSAAFRCVPMTESMRKGKQIAQLWPTVWSDEMAQSALSIDEKIAMLDGFATAAKPTNCATISSSSLEVSPRIRVFAQCSHAEPAVVGTPPECSACIDEWAEKVRATLGTSN
ncbi:unnamed protein product [Caenorhabditis bovis]|uniref:RCC1-like domain-containing protein n=1 Tax=Caenorhabditis bovis TaxID=2654633 RepID=A0A8S1EEF4_9PELO|nr:unnamed protein product [Caenorhabditis bovis]